MRPGRLDQTDQDDTGIRFSPVERRCGPAAQTTACASFRGATRHAYGIITGREHGAVDYPYIGKVRFAVFTGAAYDEKATGPGRISRAKSAAQSESFLFSRIRYLMFAREIVCEEAGFTGVCKAAVTARLWGSS